MAGKRKYRTESQGLETVVKKNGFLSSLDAIAIYPMGARDENNTVPLGMTVALLFFKPSSVISFSP